MVHDEEDGASVQLSVLLPAAARPFAAPKRNGHAAALENGSALEEPGSLAKGDVTGSAFTRSTRTVRAKSGAERAQGPDQAAAVRDAAAADEEPPPPPPPPREDHPAPQVADEVAPELQAAAAKRRKLLAERQASAAAAAAAAAAAEQASPQPAAAEPVPPPPPPPLYAPAAKQDHAPQLHAAGAPHGMQPPPPAPAAPQQAAAANTAVMAPPPLAAGTAGLGSMLQSILQNVRSSGRGGAQPQYSQAQAPAAIPVANGAPDWQQQAPAPLQQQQVQGQPYGASWTQQGWQGQADPYPATNGWQQQQDPQGPAYGNGQQQWDGTAAPMQQPAPMHGDIGVPGPMQHAGHGGWAGPPPQQQQHYGGPEGMQGGHQEAASWWNVNAGSENGRAPPAWQHEQQPGMQYQPQAPEVPRY